MAGDTISARTGGLELGAIFPHPAHSLLAAGSGLSLPAAATGPSLQNSPR